MIKYNIFTSQLLTPEQRIFTGTVKDLNEIHTVMEKISKELNSDYPATIIVELKLETEAQKENQSKELKRIVEEEYNKMKAAGEI